MTGDDVANAILVEDTRPPPNMPAILDTSETFSEPCQIVEGNFLDTFFE